MARIAHDFKFRPDMRKLTAGSVTLIAPDGAKTEISLKSLSYTCLKPGGYFDYRGFVHGQWMGPSFIDGFKLDLTDPNVLRDVSFIDDAGCELRCGKELGYGCIEVTVTGKYPKYGYEGYEGNLPGHS